MQVARSTPGRGGTRKRILYRTVGRGDKFVRPSSSTISKFRASLWSLWPKPKQPRLSPAPDPENREAHPGFVWVKSGYSEAIAWRKARLTKQRNVDLTTDGLWAMPLNTGWAPVKARRLQDWEKLKKYVPSHKQGDVCPNGVPALVEGGNNDTDSDSE